MIYDPVQNVFFPSGANSVLPQVMWHITDICPLNCPYCFSPKTEKTIPTEMVDRVLSIFTQLGVQKIDIGGGEPLVYPQLRSLIEKIHESGIFCTLTTSGVGRKENIEALPHFVSLGLTRLILSIDAYGDAHDRLRGNVNAWKSVNEILGRVDESTRSKRLRINTVVTSSVEFDSTFDKLLKWVDKSGVKEWCLIQPHPANQKDTFESYSVGEFEFEEVVRRARNLLVSDVKIIERRTNLYSNYWVLHPSGILQKHTTGAIDGVGIDLTIENAELIESIIRLNGTKVPMGEKMKIIVSSDFVTPASSELLAEISANILQKGWGTVEVESESVENTKGDLVSTILITIGLNVLSNGVYDLIKLLVNEARQSANARGEEFPKIALEDKDGPKHEESDQEKE